MIKVLYSIFILVFGILVLRIFASSKIKYKQQVAGNAAEQMCLAFFMPAF